MEPLNESSQSWLEILKNSNVFDLITIILGIILVISFLVYKKKPGTPDKQKTYKKAVLSITAIYIGWLLIGLSF